MSKKFHFKDKAKIWTKKVFELIINAVFNFMYVLYDQNWFKFHDWIIYT